MKISPYQFSSMAFLSFFFLFPSFGSAQPPQAPRFGKEAIKLKSGSPPRHITCETFKPHQITKRIDSGDKLRFSYGLTKKGWKQNGMVFKFAILAKSSKTKKPIQIFHAIINPKKDKDKIGWNKAIVDLDRFRGESITLIYSGQALNHNNGVLKIPVNGLMLWGAERIGNFNREIADSNIILISLDTLRADRLGINGYPRPTSPHIDKLASGGVNFKEAISPAPWTRPAHMSVFTGLYPSFHKVNQRIGNRKVALGSDITTLAETLRKNGYLTHAFTGSGLMAANFSFFRGFDQYQELSTKWPTKGAELIFTEGMNWIKENQKNKFFLFLHTYEIHSPFTHTEFLKDLKNPTELEELNAKYDSGILYTDQFIGKLQKYLESLGLLQNTLIIIFSDHGEDLGDHYPNTDHGHSLYDELIRVPLIFYSPERLKPRSVEYYQAELIDIMPTILEFANIQANNLKLQGKSLLPILMGKAVPSESSALSEAIDYGPDRISIRHQTQNRKLKFILAPTIKTDTSYDHFGKPYSEFVRKCGGQEFYDLRKDPTEKTNLAAKKESESQRLLEEIQKYLKSVPVQRPANLTLPPDPELKEKLRSLGY